MLKHFFGHKNFKTAERVSLIVLLLGGLAFALYWVNRGYPIKDWLFITYGQSLLLASAFALASFAAGTQLLRSIGFSDTGGLRFQERWLIASAVGVLMFATGIFLAGIFRVYGTIFFVLWPILLLAYGSRSFFREVRRVYRHRRSLRRLFLPRTVLDLGAYLFVAYGLLLVYSHVLTPDNLGYDPRWYHLPVAEHYVAAGGITKFEEGWYLGAYPQLASWLYTWAFQMPRGGLFSHVAVASHIEFVLLLMTIPGVALVARRLLGGRRVGAAAAAFFLFPSIWLYDSNLNTGADHVLAFWACPVLIALFAFARYPTGGRAAALAAVVSGAALTKLQSLYMVVPVGLAVGWIVFRRRAFLPALIGLGTALVLTSSYWLKNLMFYGDPVFPLLYKHLALRPFTPSAAAAIEEIYKTPGFAPKGSLLHKLMESVGASFTFAFIPHDWEMFKGRTPVFGFLFTLLMPAWVLLRGKRRLVLLGAGVHLGVALWFYTSHQDRFLQSIVPWMAAVVGATLHQLWHAGLLTRVCATALVAFQLVWAGDIYFFNTHPMIRDSPVRALAEHMGRGHQGQYQERFRHWNQTFREVRRKTPPDARILYHRDQDKLGLGRQTVVDGRGFQSGIDYIDLSNAGEAYRLLRHLRVSHLVFSMPDPGDDRAELAREVVFLHAAAVFAEEKTQLDYLNLMKLKAVSPSAKATLIAVASCDEEKYTSGLYTAASLAKGQPEQSLTPEQSLDALMRQATVVLFKGSCMETNEARRSVQEKFLLAWHFGDFSMYTERNPLQASAPQGVQP